MLDFQKYVKFKAHVIESLKYIREFHTPVCYCGDISTPRNVMLNETNCDWLIDMSVKRPQRPWPMNAAIYSRPLAISLKVWLRKTRLSVLDLTKIIYLINTLLIAKHIFSPETPVCPFSFSSCSSLKILSMIILFLI